MKEITRFNHVGIRVRDLQTAQAFYEKLGFKFVAGPIGPEPVAIFDHPAGMRINLILNTSDPSDFNILMDVPEKHAGYTHMALEVTDLNAVQAHLADLGIPISGGPITVPGGASFVFVRDPDNNVIELCTAAVTDFVWE